MYNKKITVVINTFNSEDKIHHCLSSIDPKVRIIIIENSNNLVNGIIWNGKNSNQQIVSDGIYIYKLHVKSLFDGAYNQSYKKMIKRKL